MGGSIGADAAATRLAVTPDFEGVDITYKPKNAAEASAGAALHLVERNALLIALLSKVLLRYFWQK